jgi:hypothetical protein
MTTCVLVARNMDADTTLGRWVNGTGSWYTYGDTGMPTASPGSSPETAPRAS